MPEIAKKEKRNYSCSFFPYFQHIPFISNSREKKFTKVCFHSRGLRKKMSFFNERKKKDSWDVFSRLFIVSTLDAPTIWKQEIQQSHRWPRGGSWHQDQPWTWTTLRVIISIASKTQFIGFHHKKTEEEQAFQITI